MKCLRQLTMKHSVRWKIFDLRVQTHFNDGISSDTLHDNTIYWALPACYTSVTLTLFQNHGSIKQFNWKLYVLIRLSWNFVRLLSTSSGSWIDHHCWLSHMFKGDDCNVSSFDKNCIVGFLMDAVQAKFFKFCIIMTLLEVYHALDFVSKSQMCQNH